MSSIRSQLKHIGFFKLLVASARIFRNKHDIFEKIARLVSFYRDLLTYRNDNPRFSFKWKDVYPCVFDKTTQTPLGAVYFYQDTWCARKVFETKPKEHHDVGSMAEMVGIISQFTPTTMVDIRPLPLQLSGLSFIKGDILHLPFSDRSISSLSSICVIEHIGLGRYGDTADAFGSEKAADELARVLAPNGNLFLSVPIDSTNKILFNAHRAFTREYVLELFKELTLVEEKYIYGDSLTETYAPQQGEGTGLYHFCRKV